MIGRTLRNQTETIPSSRRAVRLLVPGKLILETPTNPTGLELGKVTVFINLHSEDPTPGEKIDVTTQPATVSKPDGVIVQVTLELLQLSSTNFLRILALHLRGDSTRLDFILLSRRKPVAVQRNKRRNLKRLRKRIKTSSSPATKASKESPR